MNHTGKLFIDGIDAYTEFGVSVARYGYKQLIQMPAFKKLDSTDWPEEDGTETDLTEPQLDTRTLQIDFNINNVRYAEDLFDELCGNSYHTFYFVELKKTYKLRMTQNGKFKSLIHLGTMTLTFADDFPTIPTAEHYHLGESEIRQVGYEVDGLDFSQFGAWVLEGTDDNIRKAANTKDNLKVSAKNVAGVMYDGSQTYFKTKDVQIKLLIDAPDINTFWRRWNALFGTILQPESRTLYYAVLGNEYDCYYKSNSVTKFDILRNGKVWCEFSVTLTFTDYRPTGQYMLLAHEDFALVEVLVNGVPTLIRIRPKRGISILAHERGEYVVVNTGNEETTIYLNN
ncbi:MAG: hypothetical protein NC044_05390 [Prevotella sp.]|nr:hypothetical protein [Lachnospiraceae bacterium]MCM1379577.1 hypothetical protein [Bacteroides sp.]MCM1445822.1 hypothetical protein [Prevotella sp.]